jgi:hypothetical protein
MRPHLLQYRLSLGFLQPHFPQFNSIKAFCISRNLYANFSHRPAPGENLERPFATSCSQPAPLNRFSLILSRTSIQLAEDLLTESRVEFPIHLEFACPCLIAIRCSHVLFMWYSRNANTYLMVQPPNETGYNGNRKEEEW